MTRLDALLSIRTRLVILAFVIALPSLGLIGWYLTGEVRHVRDTARARVDLLAAGTADDLRRFMAHLRGELDALAERAAVRAVDPKACDPFLADFVQSYRGHAVLAVRDLRGGIVCVAPPTPQGQRVAEATPALTDAPAAGTVSDAFNVPGTGRWYTAVHHAIDDGNGVRVGTLSTAVDLSWLNAELLGGVPEHAVVSVVDASNAIVLRSARHETFVGTRRPAGEPSALDASPDSYRLVAGRDGVVRLVALRPVPPTQWRVVAGLPEKDAMGEERAALYTTVAVVAGGLLFATVLAWRISVGIERPIRRLAQTAAAVAAGRTTARAGLLGPPEIRAVAGRFNDMLDAMAYSEARLRGVFESAVDAIIIANGQQEIVQANRAAAAMLGTTVDDMIGTPLERFIPLAQRAAHRAAVQAFGDGTAAARHMGAAREVQALRADGSEFPIEASIAHLEINGQRLYTVIHRDATERKRDQAALVEGKAKLEAALASMNDAVAIVDADGRFREVNAAFASFLRCQDLASCPRSAAEAGQIVETTFADGSAAPPARWAISRALRGESAAGVEYGLCRRDTGERWIGSHSFAPIRGADGAIVGAVVVARDVTEAKEAQADLAASHAALQRLISAQDRVQEEERARIARELHDDLQQTLAAVRIGLGELAERLQAAGSGNLALAREADTLAAQAIMSTRRIVDDLRPQMIEDLGLVPTLHNLAGRFARRTGIACTLEATDALEDALAAQPALSTCLFRVAQEALNNVVKHARARHVEIRLGSPADGQVAMSVVDDGRGIRSADRRKPESFGLQGMNERVRAQGGSLRVERLGRGGTLVEAVLPLTGPPAEPPRDDAAPFDDSGAAALDAAPVPRLLSQTTRLTLQSVIDAVAFSVAVVDRGGRIRFVNRAWLDFAEDNGSPGARGAGPGVNYLDVCRRSAHEDAYAAAALRGLLDVIEGRSTAFSCDYPCHSAAGPRWFRMHATPMSSGEVLVMHVRTSDAGAAHDRARPDGAPPGPSSA